MSPAPRGGAILLYDGVCGLCNRLVRFALARDPGRRLRYAALQSRFAREALRRHGKDPDDLDTVGLLTEAGAPSEALLVRSRAVIGVLRRLTLPWRLVGAVAAVVPRALLDAVYRLVARIRYRVFGRSDRCEIPSSDERFRFLEMD